jgi:hypothetical protein
MVHLPQTTSVASGASSLPQVGLRGEPGSESRSDLSDVIVSVVFLSFGSSIVRQKAHRFWIRISLSDTRRDIIVT